MSLETIDVTADADDAGTRLDRFLAGAAPQFSRSRLQALIEQGHVLLNGVVARARTPVRKGDQVRITIPAPSAVDAAPEDIPLRILHEDDDLLVIDKPAGIVVHPGAGNASHTLVNALLHHCRTLSGIGGSERPGIVHRLDKETSGCLVVAKNDAAHQGLSRQFAARTTTKIYLALVLGRPRHATGRVDAAIERHPVDRQKMAVARAQRGRSALTEYRVLQSNGEVSLVQCTLHSGRTHQVRVHLHHLGHPVVGDKLYGRRDHRTFPRHMLHAWKLGFTHPVTGTPHLFEAPIPAEFALDFRGAP